MHDDVLSALAEARDLGFLGPGPLSAHMDSASAFAAALGPVAGPGLDLGSGGGVPGLHLAATYADIRWVLLDRNRRRTSFLSRVVADLGWVGRVEVVRSSAWSAAHSSAWREGFDVVVARSFGAPALTAEIGSGFLAVGARLAVAEPPEPPTDRWPEAPLAALGLVRVESPDRIAVFRRVRQLQAGAPRTEQAIVRRPRW